MEDQERRLRRLEGCEAIRALIARYALGADRKNDPEILGPLFHDNAVWEAVDVARFEGRASIADGLADLGRQFVTWSLHYMVAPLIEMDDDGTSARCRWHLWELCTMTDDGGEERDTWLGGWYDSELSFQDGRWGFDKVLLDMRLTSPATPPWTDKKVIS